jgi:hypothetical protein
LAAQARGEYACDAPLTLLQSALDAARQACAARPNDLLTSRLKPD